MTGDVDEAAELAYLKRALGGELTDEEKRLLAHLEGTRAGDRARESAERARKLLARLAKLGPSDTADIRTRFEQRVRKDAVAFRRQFVSFCAGVLGVCAAGGLLGWVAAWIYEPDGERIRHIYRLWILLGGLWVVICAAVYHKNRQLLVADDISGWLRSHEGPRHRTPGRVLRSLAVFVLIVALTARHYGWVESFAGVTVLWTVMWLLARKAQRAIEAQRRKQDAELWGWWYDEGRIEH